MPELTTLKVPRQVRDRLAAAADVRGMTVRALLDELSRTAMDAALMERAARRMAAVRESDPGAWADYLREGREWEQGTVEPVEA